MKYDSDLPGARCQALVEDQHGTMVIPGLTTDVDYDRVLDLNRLSLNAAQPAQAGATEREPG